MGLGCAQAWQTGQSTASLSAQRPPGVTSCRGRGGPALISAPGRKTRGNLTGWQTALIAPPPLPSPLARPCHQALSRIVPTGTTAGAPKPSLAPAAPLASHHSPTSNPVWWWGVGAGVCTRLGGGRHIAIPLPLRPKGHGVGRNLAAPKRTAMPQFPRCSESGESSQNWGEPRC